MHSILLCSFRIYYSYTAEIDEIDFFKKKLFLIWVEVNIKHCNVLLNTVLNQFLGIRNCNGKSSRFYENDASSCMS